jgi:hypothetical protein
VVCSHLGAALGAAQVTSRVNEEEWGGLGRQPTPFREFSLPLRSDEREPGFFPTAGDPLVTRVVARLTAYLSEDGNGRVGLLVDRLNEEPFGLVLEDAVVVARPNCGG